MRNDLEKLYDRTVLSKHVKFHTYNKGVRGWLPNLPNALRRDGVHPLDHYKVIRCIGTEYRGDMRLSAFEFKRGYGFTNVLIEIISPDRVDYWETQMKVEDFDAWMDTARILSLPKGE